MSSFEFMEVAFSINRQTVRVAVIYCPGHPGTDRSFMEEFSSFIEYFSSKNGKLLICGNFNYWVDDPLSKPYSAEFVELIDLNNYSNHVSGPTHASGHTLDLVLSPSDSGLVENVDVVPMDPNISDHALVAFCLNIPRPPSYTKTITFRNYRNIDQTAISLEIESSLNTIDTSSLSADGVVGIYKDFFQSISDRYCPEVVKSILMRDDSPWYDSSVTTLRRQRRRAEQRRRRLRTLPSRLEYMSAREAVVCQVASRKTEYYKHRVAACGGNQQRLFALLNSLLHQNSDRILPPSASDADLASGFCNFFTSKISTIRDVLDHTRIAEDFSVDFSVRVDITSILSYFRSVSLADVSLHCKTQ